MWLIEIRVWIQVPSYDLVQERYPSLARESVTSWVDVRYINSELGMTNPGMPLKKEVGKRRAHTMCCVKNTVRVPGDILITQEVN